jgi:hypothetical protein
MHEAVEARDVVRPRILQAAQLLRTSDPMKRAGRLIDQWLQGPMSDYAANALTPGAVPCEPSFSEAEPNVLRFTIEPLGSAASPVSRRDEVTRVNREYVQQAFGRDALRWFDHRSEEWRGVGTHSRLHYGAWFGTAYDADGLASSKVYYELMPEHLGALPGLLQTLVRTAMHTMPTLRPVFTSIRCGRASGGQRVTFLHRGPLRLNDLAPLMQRLGLEHQLPGFMQVVGISLGGRFDLPERSVLLGLSETPEGPELKLEVMLGMLPDLPPNFLDLLTLGLAERPHKVQALGQWLWAFTPETQEWPGKFSVLSIRATPRTPARVSLYLRPAEFEVKQRLGDVARIRPRNAAAAAGAAW